MVVVLLDGRLVVKTRLGSGLFEAEVKSPEKKVRFDDGRWHRIKIGRRAREVNILFSNP